MDGYKRLFLVIASYDNHPITITKWEEADPIDGTVAPLFHPRQQKWHDHFMGN
jgi:hypothetical protein